MSKTKLALYFLLGGFIGYVVGVPIFTVTLGIIIDGSIISAIELSGIALRVGWRFYPLFIPSFIFKGTLAVILMLLRVKVSKPTFWCIALIGGIIAGIVAGIISYLFMKMMPLSDLLICCATAWFSSGAVIGLCINIDKP